MPTLYSWVYTVLSKMALDFWSQSIRASSQSSQTWLLTPSLFAKRDVMAIELNYILFVARSLFYAIIELSGIWATTQISIVRITPQSWSSYDFVSFVSVFLREPRVLEIRQPHSSLQGWSSNVQGYRLGLFWGGESSNAQGYHKKKLALILHWGG